MDSFLDNTEVIKMKLNYDRLMVEDNSIFANTRHRLLQEFESTPVKSIKLNNASKKRSHASAESDVDIECTELRNQLVSRDVDISVLKSNIIQMETRLSAMEVSAREARIGYDKEMMKLKSEKDREASKTVEIRSKLQYVMESEKNSRDEIRRLEEELHRQKRDMDKKLLASHKEKLDATDQALEAKAAWFEEKSELHAQIMSQMGKISAVQTKLDECQAQLELRKKVQYENAEHKREIDQLKTDLQEEMTRNKDLKQQLSDHEDNLVITKALKSDLDLVPDMKIELEKLRMDNEHLRYNEQNTLLLEEEVRSLKKKIEMLLPAQERLSQLEVDNEELLGRLHRWEAADTSGSRRPQSPCSLSRRIQELEAYQANMMLTQGELQTSMHSKQRNLEQHLAENRKLTTELTTEKNKVSHSSSLIKQLQRKLLLVTRERDSYRSLLDSYENEVTINFDLEKKAQIQRLEAIVQGYKEQSRELEAELQTVTDKLVETQAQCCQLQQQLNTAISSDQQAPSLEDKELIIQLRERMSELESNLIITQREKDILEARIEQRHLQGDYDPSKTKVVHFTLNPCALAQKARCEELQKLKEENERLTKRNQILEEHGGNVEDLTVQVQEKLLHPSPSKEVEEMRAQLQREEMRNKRLMEVFKKTSQEFREVCYQLTGYKIDIPCANQYRLTSMYADCPRDHFLFQQNSQGEIQMLQTDFSLTVQDAIELYLQKHNSIPLFLSHITMELFGRQTMNLG